MADAITTERIHEIADQIADEGSKPTLAKVREALGGGSFTTISEAMKLWRQNHKSPAPEVIAMPEAVVNAGGAAISTIWVAAQQTANAQLDRDRDSLSQAREGFEIEQAEAAEVADQMSADIDRLQIDIDESRKQTLEALDKAERYEKNAAEVAGELSKQKADTERLGDLLAGEKERREHSEKQVDSTNEKLVAMSGQLERERGELAKVRESFEHQKAAQAKLDEENQKLTGYLKSANNAMSEVQEHLRKSKEDAKSAGNEIRHLQDQVSDDRKRLAAVEKQYADSNERLIAATNEAAELRGKLSVISSSTGDQNDSNIRNN